MTDQSAWQNIPSGESETGDIARARIGIVLEKDPFVRMLSPEIRGCMIEGFAQALIFDRPQVNHVVAGSHTQIKRQAKKALDAMPMGFLTDGFKDHVLGLIAYAIRPHPDRDEWHNVI